MKWLLLLYVFAISRIEAFTVIYHVLNENFQLVQITSTVIEIEYQSVES